ncbi:hypothetical protein HDV05_007924 [Chytridiales sp. JEL 0842]|nr:hypothetical protein HDV05_007924 [Chytridiales sp. JEL 0842]
MMAHPELPVFRPLSPLHRTSTDFFPTSMKTPQERLYTFEHLSTLVDVSVAAAVGSDDPNHTRILKPKDYPTFPSYIVAPPTVESMQLVPPRTILPVIGDESLNVAPHPTELEQDEDMYAPPPSTFTRTVTVHSEFENQTPRAPNSTATCFVSNRTSVTSLDYSVSQQLSRCNTSTRTSVVYDLDSGPVSRLPSVNGSNGNWVLGRGLNVRMVIEEDLRLESLETPVTPRGMEGGVLGRGVESLKNEVDEGVCQEEKEEEEHHLDIVDLYASEEEEEAEKVKLSEGTETVGHVGDNDPDATSTPALETPPPLPLKEDRTHIDLDKMGILDPEPTPSTTTTTTSPKQIDPSAFQTPGHVAPQKSETEARIISGPQLVSSTSKVSLVPIEVLQTLWKQRQEQQSSSQSSSLTSSTSTSPTTTISIPSPGSPTLNTTTNSTPAGTTQHFTSSFSVLHYHGNSKTLPKNFGQPTTTQPQQLKPRSKSFGAVTSPTTSLCSPTSNIPPPPIPSLGLEEEAKQPLESAFPPPLPPKQQQQQESEETCNVPLPTSPPPSIIFDSKPLPKKPILPAGLSFKEVARRVGSMSVVGIGRGKGN